MYLAPLSDRSYTRHRSRLSCANSPEVHVKAIAITTPAACVIMRSLLPGSPVIFEQIGISGRL